MMKIGLQQTILRGLTGKGTSVAGSETDEGGLTAIAAVARPTVTREELQALFAKELGWKEISETRARVSKSTAPRA